MKTRLELGKTYRILKNDSGMFVDDSHDLRYIGEGDDEFKFNKASLPDDRQNWIGDRYQGINFEDIEKFTIEEVKGEL